MRTPRFGVIVVAAMAVFLAGCTDGRTDVAISADSQHPSSQYQTPKTWDELLTIVLADARARGANSTQLAIVESGEVSFADYQTAVTRTLSCMRDAGIGVIGDSVTNTRGYPEIMYSYAAGSEGRSEAETDSISQACVTANSLFVEALYRDSPAVLELIDAVFEPYRTAVLACVRDHNIEVDPNAPRQVIESSVLDVRSQTNFDCFRESGYYPNGK